MKKSQLLTLAALLTLTTSAFATNVTDEVKDSSHQSVPSVPTPVVPETGSAHSLPQSVTNSASSVPTPAAPETSSTQDDVKHDLAAAHDKTGQK